MSNIDIYRFLIDNLKIYLPISAGPIDQAAQQSLNGAREIVNNFKRLARSLGLKECPTVNPEMICKVSNLNNAMRLKELFKMYGSDKHSDNGYYYIYAQIFSDPDRTYDVFEVGLGTPNADVLSNMGESGRPGASLRAFRDFLPKSSIYGADIDRRVLFEETRIKTFFVDQTDRTTFDALDPALPAQLDVVIDDGLHSPLANLTTLDWALTKVKVGGWIVIEDIANYSLSIWELVGMLIPKQNFVCNIISVASGHYNFVIMRLR